LRVPNHPPIPHGGDGVRAESHPLAAELAKVVNPRPRKDNTQLRRRDATAIRTKPAPLKRGRSTAVLMISIGGAVLAIVIGFALMSGSSAPPESNAKTSAPPKPPKVEPRRDDVRISYEFDGGTAESDYTWDMLDDKSLVAIITALHKDRGAEGWYELGRQCVARKLWRDAQAAFDKCVGADPVVDPLLLRA